MSVNGKNEKTAHLLWCALIALCLARQEGRVRSEQQENLFLVRWFADAERQRRFSRDVATDIRWILQQGRSLGVRAQLAKKLDYIWRSTSGDIMAQTELFRLTWRLLECYSPPVAGRFSLQKNQVFFFLWLYWQGLKILMTLTDNIDDSSFSESFYPDAARPFADGQPPHHSHAVAGTDQRYVRPAGQRTD